MERWMLFMKNKPVDAVNDRPFSPAVLAKARTAVENYRFAFWREDGRFVAQCVELDTLGVGPTSAAALAEARSLALTAAAVLIEARQRLPLPAAAQARTVQVNIRLSPAEKRALEDAASAGGFRGISDYLRIRGLALG
jgi:hypothetical protein